MRPRNEILGDLANKTDKSGPSSAPFYDIAILEVLLDIRDLLRRRQQSTTQSPAE